MAKVTVKELHRMPESNSLISLTIDGREVQLSLAQARDLAVQIMDAIYNMVLRNKVSPRRVRVKKAE